MWDKIPDEIQDELGLIRKHTRRTGKEASITFCKKSHKEHRKDKLHIGNYFKGDNESTEIGDCSLEYGVSERVGDAHSHPTDIDTLGIIPSEADLTVNLETTFENDKRQISCVTSPQADLVHCFSSKDIPSRKKINSYKKAARDGKLVSPYVADNIEKDFEIRLYDRDSGNYLETPEPERVIENAFGNSLRPLRKSLQEMDRGTFCNFIQDITNHKDNRISETCKTELKKKGLLDRLNL